MIENLKALGKTVFLTTHYMDEAQRLADRVAIIAGGVIVAEGTPATLAGREATRTRIAFAVPVGPAELPERIRAIATVTGHEVTIESVSPVDDLHELTGWAKQNGFDLAGLQVSRPTLEDIYLDLTKQEPNE
jgi:ABC-2 type transport system ATP-binding protein